MLMTYDIKQWCKFITNVAIVTYLNVHWCSAFSSSAAPSPSLKTSHSTRAPSVYIKPDKSAPTTPIRPNTISRMNPFKRTSVASLANTSDHSSEGGGSNRNSLEAPIELSEQACCGFIFSFEFLSPLYALFIVFMFN